MRIKGEEVVDKITKSFKVKEELSKDIWEESVDGYKMRKEIRENLLRIADEFIEFLVIELDVSDITMTGSLANYNWSEFSDIDLHILMDFEEIGANEVLIKEFFDAKRINWNTNHEIYVKGFEVELYVQDDREPHISSGVYSVLKDKWLVTPNPDAKSYDEEKLVEKVEQWMKIIDEVVEEYEGTTNPVKVIDDINKIRRKLKKYRSTGLEKDGEFSYENLVFKYLRRSGYIGKLIDLKNKLYDKTLSIDEAMKLK